jgi:hypothetical protein
MNNVGLIWHYGDDHKRSDMIECKDDNQINSVRHEEYPLLGRRVELLIVATQLILLDEPLTSVNRRRDLAALIFEGKKKQSNESID